MTPIDLSIAVVYLIVVYRWHNHVRVYSARTGSYPHVHSSDERLRSSLRSDIPG